MQQIVQKNHSSMKLAPTTPEPPREAWRHGQRGLYMLQCSRSEMVLWDEGDMSVIWSDWTWTLASRREREEEAAEKRQSLRGEKMGSKDLDGVSEDRWWGGLTLTLSFTGVVGNAGQQQQQWSPQTPPKPSHPHNQLTKPAQGEMGNYKVGKRRRQTAGAASP